MYFPPGFDRNRAIELLQLVEQAYGQYEAFTQGKPWTLSGNYTLVRELEYTGPGAGTGLIFKENTFMEKELQTFLQTLGKKVKNLPLGFIAQHKHDLYIIFRGTRTPTEWIRNLNLNLKPYIKPGFGKVHEGFLQLFQVFQKEIKDIPDKMGKINKIFIAGHSLGGAVATLFASEVSYWVRSKNLAIYTFASPRVGDNEFVEAYNLKFGKQTFRICNTSDLVVSIPLPAEFMGFLGGYFSHVDTPIDFTIQKNDVEKNHATETYREALVQSRQPFRFFRWLFS